MDAKDLEAELRVLPGQIDKARQTRDILTARLISKWPTAMVNDHDFVEAYQRAEAAGQEVLSLTRRWIEAGRRYREMTNRTLV
jgi:hypothetical protein